jgi:hypothetical protein
VAAIVHVLEAVEVVGAVPAPDFQVAIARLGVAEGVLIDVQIAGTLAAPEGQAIVIVAVAAPGEDVPGDLNAAGAGLDPEQAVVPDELDAADDGGAGQDVHRKAFAFRHRHRALGAMTGDLRVGRDADDRKVDVEARVAEVDRAAELQRVAELQPGLDRVVIGLREDRVAGSGDRRATNRAGPGRSSDRVGLDDAGSEQRIDLRLLAGDIVMPRDLRTKCNANASAQDEPDRQSEDNQRFSGQWVLSR